MMPTGQDLLNQAAKSIGEDYVFGADVPLDGSEWHGPWDCAEKITYDVFKVTGKIYGCLESDSDNPDPWTGAWASDVRKGKVISIPVSQAAKTPGAILLRYRQGGHHIVFSTGDGSTIEAKSASWGVCRGSVGSQANWDYGILIPDVQY